MATNVLDWRRSRNDNLIRNDKFNTYEKYSHETETAFLPMCC